MKLRLLPFLLLGMAMPTMAKPLNILLFTADDLGYEVLDPVMKPKLNLTPNLDRFADQGTNFRQGYVNVSICQPSRMVMGTGRYPHNTGAPELHTALPEGQVLFPQSLREAG